jgi:hypothetical protein
MADVLLGKDAALAERRRKEADECARRAKEINKICRGNPFRPEM